jgi:hypothetical protein
MIWYRRTHLRINKKAAHTKTAVERKFVESEKRRRHEFLTHIRGCENKAGDYPWPIYRNGPSLLPEPFNRKIISRVSSVEKGDGAEVYFVIAQRACCVNSRRVFVIRVFTLTISSPFSFC